jgi:hypothetical protein
VLHRARSHLKNPRGRNLVREMAPRMVALCVTLGVATGSAKAPEALVECRKEPCLDAAKVAAGELLVRWPSGKKWKEIQVDHGKATGAWHWFWPSGKAMATISFKDGKRHGAAEFWYLDGKLQAKGRYENDEMSEKFAYYAFDGKPTQTFPVTLDDAQTQSLVLAAKKVRNAAAALDVLAQQKAPKGLTGEPLDEYERHSLWLRDAADRVDGAGILGLLLAGTPVGARDVLSTTFHEPLGVAFAAQPGFTRALVSELSALNMQWLALQSALKNESREFEELPGASRARHLAARKALVSMM